MQTKPQEPQSDWKKIEWLIQEYNIIFEDRSGAMSVSRGKIHKYLGMNLDYTVSEIARISILEYIYEILTEFDKWTQETEAPSLLRHQRTCLRLTRNVRISVQTRPRDSITWWPRHYTSPRGIDLIPAHKSHFLLPE